MDGAGGHALIVEDDLVCGLGMQALLEPLGFRSFAFASTAAQALEQARLHRPDLVTLDLGLLDGDGLGAARALEAEIGPLPTLFVTGRPEALRHLAGALVVEKPVGEGALASAVRAASARMAPGV